MENNLNEEFIDNTIFRIDMNILQNISENTFRYMIKDIYNDLIKLYNIHPIFKKVVINILIENDTLLLDIISYIYSTNKDVILYSCNFIDIYNKWNNYKEYRIKNQNIYLYLINITNKSKILYNYNDIQDKLNINNFSNLGVSLNNCKYLRNIPIEYKKDNLINNINIAYKYIQENKSCVYMNISPDLYDYSILDNFKLLCLAISKHSTLYTYLKNYKIKYNMSKINKLENITSKQLLILVKCNYNIYKNLSIKDKKRLDIIEEVILNTKNAFNNIIKTISVITNRNIIYNIGKFTEKFDLNNIKYDKQNRNYIYFILKYITNKCINEDIKLYITNLLQDNNLFKICYDKLKLYITNMDYQLFDIDNIEININTIPIYYNYIKISNNHLWKINIFNENIDISLNKIIEETNNNILDYINNQHISKNNSAIFANDRIIKDKINIKSINTIYLVLNNIDINYYYCHHIYKQVINYHPLLIDLITQLQHNNICNNDTLNFYNIIKQHYLPELNKLETIEYEINGLLH